MFLGSVVIVAALFACGAGECSLMPLIRATVCAKSVPTPRAAAYGRGRLGSGHLAFPITLPLPRFRSRPARAQLDQRGAAAGPAERHGGPAYWRPGLRGSSSSRRSGGGAARSGVGGAARIGPAGLDDHRGEDGPAARRQLSGHPPPGAPKRVSVVVSERGFTRAWGGGQRANTLAPRAASDVDLPPNTPCTPPAILATCSPPAARTSPQARVPARCAVQPARCERLHRVPDAHWPGRLV